MVRAFVGDSTMTSVPPRFGAAARLPFPAALGAAGFAALAAFVAAFFVVFFAAGVRSRVVRVAMGSSYRVRVIGTRSRSHKKRCESGGRKRG